MADFQRDSACGLDAVFRLDARVLMVEAMKERLRTYDGVVPCMEECLRLQANRARLVELELDGAARRARLAQVLEPGEPAA